MILSYTLADFTLYSLTPPPPPHPPTHNPLIKKILKFDVLYKIILNILKYFICISYIRFYVE